MFKIDKKHDKRRIKVIKRGFCPPLYFLYTYILKMKNNRQIIVKLIKRNLEKFAPRDLEIYDTDLNYYETIQAYIRYLRKCKKTTLYKEL